MKYFFVGLVTLTMMFIAALLLCGFIQTIGCFFAGFPQPHQNVPPVTIVVTATLLTFGYSSFAVGRYFELSKKAGAR